MIDAFQTVVPQMHFMYEPKAASGLAASVTMQSYFEGQVDYPTCSLSGRVMINPSDARAEHVRDFLNGYTIEVSDNHTRIDEFLDHVTEGNFTGAFIADSEIPYLAAGAFVNNRINVSVVSNFLRWHQMMKEGQVVFSSLFDADGNWSEEARTYMLADSFFRPPLSSDQLEIMRVRMLALPKSQQKLCRFVEPDVFQYEAIALEAQRVFLEVMTNHSFGIQPRLGGNSVTNNGEFTKEALVAALVLKHARLMHTPYPGVASGNKVGGLVGVNPSGFSGHDVVHWTQMHDYAPEVVDALRELLADFGNLLSPGSTMPKDMWFIADFDFHYADDVCMSVKEEFNALIKETRETVRGFREFSAWEWNMALQMHHQHDRWQRDYGLSIDKVPALAELYRWVQLASPYLAGRSRKQSIYLLQKLTMTQACTPSDVRAFFMNQPAKLPKLRLIGIRNEFGAGIGSWVVANGVASEYPSIYGW